MKKSLFLLLVLCAPTTTWAETKYEEDLKISFPIFESKWPKIDQNIIGRDIIDGIDRLVEKNVIQTITKRPGSPHGFSKKRRR